MIRFALPLLLAIVQAVPPQAPVPAPTPAATLPMPAPQPGLVTVALDTTDGRIVLALDRAHAPVTTANFLRYLDAGRLNGIAFYRAMALGNGAGLIQAGVRDARRLYAPIAHEPTSATGLSHTEGTISMARVAPGSATADFFITLGDMRSLDANPSAPGDNAGFAAFGHVVEGLDVVRRIQAEPTSSTLGEGVMRGQMLAAPVRIVSAKRLPSSPAR